MKQMDMQQAIRAYLEDRIVEAVPPAGEGDDPASLAVIAVQRAMDRATFTDFLIHASGRLVAIQAIRGSGK